MKLQLDTEEKSVKIEESVNLKELYEILDKLLPNGLWNEYTIETNVSINWTSPIVIDNTPPYNPYTPPCNPYTPPNTYPWITYTTTSDFEVKEFNENDFSVEKNSMNIQNGVYNIEI